MNRMYYTMNVSLNYFRKHVLQNIFSENIIKFYGGTNEMAISKDMIIADLIALDPNYAAILLSEHIRLIFQAVHLSPFHEHKLPVQCFLPEMMGIQHIPFQMP